MKNFMVRATLVGLLLCFNLAPCALAADDGPVVAGELGARLDAYLTRLESLGFSGVALVQKHSDVVLRKGYGWADKKDGLKMTTGNVFDLGSITKQFTAAAILRLEADGKLSTTDKITRFFKDVPPDKQGITLHQLLTHSAGLESDFADSDYAPVGRDEYVRLALASKLMTPPGEHYEYSNAGYSLLAAIVELTSGMSYEAFLAERLFKPAGMVETGYKLPHWPEARIARGSQDGKDWGTIIARISPPDAPYWVLRGNGGIHTTLHDVARWNEALYDDRVLPAAERVKLMSPYIDEDESGKTRYAYGWVVEKTARGTRDIWHNGGNDIYSAELHRYVDESVLICVGTTVAELKSTPVFATVEKIVFGQPYDLPPAAVQLPAASLAAPAGRYKLATGGELALKVEGERLALSLRGPDAYAAWYGAAGDDLAHLRALDKKAEGILSRSVTGDYAPLVAAAAGDAGRGRDPEEVRKAEAELMADRRSRLGAFQRFEMLGTMPVRGDIAVTEAELVFEKGTVFNRYVWRGEHLLEVRGVPSLPTYRLVPQSESEFVAFDVRLGTGPRLRLEAGGTSLVLVTPAAELKTERVR